MGIKSPPLRDVRHIGAGRPPATDAQQLGLLSADQVLVTTTYAGHTNLRP
jgi:hypothetical protein